MLGSLYMLLTLFFGASTLWEGAIYPGLAGLAGPALCWFAASDLKDVLFAGTASQRLANLAAALAFVAVSLGLVYHSGYWVGLFGYELTGVSWCLVGFVAGGIGTTRRHAAE